MADSKSNSTAVNAALADFTKKFARFTSASSSGSQDQSDIKIESPLKSLQDQINERENERASLLRRQFMEYISPVTADIEQDEENLLKAYKLFCKLVEANNTLGDSTTHTKSLLLTSPICKKSEYTSLAAETRFSFLLLWFVVTNPDATFIPQLEQDTNGSLYLNFIERDLWKPTLFEKEIMQVCG